MEEFESVIGLWIVIGVFFGIICAAFCNELAKTKGHDPGMAVVLGFFFGWFALVFYAGLPDRKLQTSARELFEWLRERDFNTGLRERAVRNEESIHQ